MVFLKHVSIHHFKEEAEAEDKENKEETKHQTHHKEEDKAAIDNQVEEEPLEDKAYTKQ